MCDLQGQLYSVEFKDTLHKCEGRYIDLMSNNSQGVSLGINDKDEDLCGASDFEPIIRLDNSNNDVNTWFSQEKHTGLVPSKKHVSTIYM